MSTRDPYGIKNYKERIEKENKGEIERNELLKELVNEVKNISKAIEGKSSKVSRK